MTFCICISQIPYRIHCDLERAPADFSTYLCDDTPDCVDIVLTHEDLLWEKQAAEAAGEEIHLEKSAILRKIAAYSLHHDRLLIHGACIAYEEKGYLFLAPSTTGKTTHISLWKKHLGQSVTVINGDKPILRLHPTITAFGTPWCGKEGYGCNSSVALSALVEVKRGTVNRIYPMKKADAFACVYRQCFMKGGSAEDTARMVAAVRYLTEQLPAYTLECDMSDEAFFCSYEALTGKQP